MVTAKFFVSEITHRAYNKGAAEVTLSPVSRLDENRQWAAATPSGTIKMTILNEVAAEQFELGKEYLITFEPAPALSPARVGL